MAKSVANLGLKSYAELFSTEEQRQEETVGRLAQVPLSDLHLFKDNPFKFTEDEELADIVLDVAEHGVSAPALVRPLESGGYEIITGQRHHRACEILNMEQMPVIIREMDDDTAAIALVNHYVQQKKLLPSERAFAYKMRLDAMKRSAGRPLKENGGQLDPHFLKGKSRDILADQVGESSKQISRYIRLTYLLPPLLDEVDNKRLPFSPAVEVSYLSLDQQGWLLDTMDCQQTAPSLDQAKRMKALSQKGKLTEDMILGIMSEVPAPEKKLVFDKKDDISGYFPKSYTPDQMKDVIKKLLEGWARKRQREQEQSR